MEKVKNFINSSFLRVYPKLPHQVQRFICLGLKHYYKPSSNIKKLRFQGEFTVRLPKNNHFKMINYGGMIEHETFWEGAFETFENDLGWLWIELCEISEIILDIGANTGIYTLAAKAVNPKTRIYAFEPSIHTYNKLCKNVRLNRFDIECEKDAISNHSAEKVFYDLPNSSDNASLSPEKMKNWNGYRGEILEYKVGATSISDYIKHKNIPKIDLVKIDIEMHEPEAIEGLGEYLYKYKPIIILEVLSDEIAEKLNKLFELNDYELFHLKKGKKAEKLEHFKMCKEYLDNWEWNFIIFHKKNKEKVKKHTSLYTNLISS